MEPEYNQEEPQRNRHLIFIIVTYLLLTVSTHFSAQASSFNQNAFNKLNNSNERNVSIQNVFSVFNSQNYEGKWNTRDLSGDTVLSQSQGKFTMYIKRDLQKHTYELQFKINNGEYIDEGCVYLRFFVNSIGWQTSRSGSLFSVSTKQNATVSAFYKLDKILQTQDEKQLLIPKTTFTFDISQKKALISILLEDEKSQYISAKMVIEGRQSKLLKSIVFAILLFFISYMQFSAIMEILRSVIEGNQSPTHYSFLTMMMATMWDAVLCIVAFVCAFDNQQNLIMFIMPAFLLCLLFTNLELRLMLMIYQANSETNSMRQLIWLMLIYPILLIANFNVLFFIGISLIFLPQIYNNGINGVRPQLDSPLYSKFLIIRFLLIFYLRCFPYNIFELEPNYNLGIACIFIIGIQLLVLWYQKAYGPKRVIPTFLLPTLFNYFYQQIENIQESTELTECAICLNSLAAEPANENDLGYQVQFRLMKTPCQHKYHGLCLVKWMKVKMECPQCRNKLPPFQ